MCWSGSLLNDNKENTLYFKVKAEKSIFIVSTVCKTCCKDLLAFEKHIQLLYEERVNKVTFASSDGLLRIELKREEYGRIKQYFFIMEESTKSFIEIIDYFDQTFLPELKDNIEGIIVGMNNK